jgi:small-conductance mechanosensitive channel
MLDTVLYDDVTVFDIIVVLFILVVIAVVGKVIALEVRRSLKDRAKKDQVENAIKLINFIIFIAAIIAVLPILGIDPTGLLVAGGLAAIVLGFASQSIVANLISGVFLMFERPMKIGDVVEIDTQVGTVEDIRTISTTIKRFDGMYVRIPNEKVFTGNIVNTTQNAARRFEYTVGIRYADDADRAVALIKELIDRHPLTLVNPKPLVFVESLGDNSVNISVRAWAPTAEMTWWFVKTELLWKIKRELEENDIKVPFPQREVWFNSELELKDLRKGG